MNYSVVALLPIKENSERVKGKNFRNFIGKPLYYWVLNKLIASKYISEIIIDTDSNYLLEKLNNYNGKIILVERPEKLRGGLIPMNDIIKYDISLVNNQNFLQTHCTNPLISIQTIDCAIEQYFENIDEYDSLFSVNKVQKRLYSSDLKPINHDLNKMLRTQDLEPVYEENSNLFVFSKESFKENNNNRIGKKPFLFEQNYLEALDIDTEEDFLITEAVYEKVIKSQL